MYIRSHKVDPAGKPAGLALGKLYVQHFLDCFELVMDASEAGSSVFRGERLHLPPDLLLANINGPECSAAKVGET